MDDKAVELKSLSRSIDLGFGFWDAMPKGFGSGLIPINPKNHKFSNPINPIDP